VTNVFSTPETSVHVLDKNREISPLERERGRLRGKGSITGERTSYCVVCARVEGSKVSGTLGSRPLGLGEVHG